MELCVCSHRSLSSLPYHHRRPPSSYYHLLLPPLPIPAVYSARPRLRATCGIFLPSSAFGSARGNPSRNSFSFSDETSTVVSEQLEDVSIETAPAAEEEDLKEDVSDEEAPVVVGGGGGEESVPVDLLNETASAAEEDSKEDVSDEEAPVVGGGGGGGEESVPVDLLNKTASAAEEEDSKEDVSVEEAPVVGGGGGEESVPVDLLNKINLKLDSFDTTSILIYGSGALVALWITSSIVIAVDSLPLFPKVMEAVGLGFTVWFTARYLIFKKNRDELFTQIGGLAEQIMGPTDD